MAPEVMVLEPRAKLPLEVMAPEVMEPVPRFKLELPAEAVMLPEESVKPLATVSEPVKFADEEMV